jgi:hypothetical protein
MAKKKSISSADIISYYMDYVLQHNAQPTSIYNFAKANNFEEQEFYKYFGNFNALEQSIFKEFFDNAYNLLEKNEDFKSFDSRNKLLSFYYTFFEILTMNRSFVVYMLKRDKDHLQKHRSLLKLKERFSLFIKHLDIVVFEVKEEKLEKAQNMSIQQSAWLQLMITIKFWLEDTSPSFEKTDIFIEKAVNTSFDLIDIKPLKSIIDLGKFLYKEKMHMN